MLSIISSEFQKIKRYHIRGTLIKKFSWRETAA